MLVFPTIIPLWNFVPRRIPFFDIGLFLIFNFFSEMLLYPFRFTIPHEKPKFSTLKFCATRHSLFAALVCFYFLNVLLKFHTIHFGLQFHIRTWKTNFFHFEILCHAAFPFCGIGLFLFFKCFAEISHYPFWFTIPHSNMKNQFFPLWNFVPRGIPFLRYWFVFIF